MILRGQRAFFFALAYLGWFVSAYVFMAATAAVLYVMWRRQFASDARLALLAIINATLISMAGAVIARFLFSPFESGLRLFPFSDSTAVYLYIWARRIIVVGVWGYVLLQTALLLGLPPAGYVVAAKILGVILTALLVVLVTKGPVSALIVLGVVIGVQTTEHLRTAVA